MCTTWRGAATTQRRSTCAPAVACTGCQWALPEFAADGRPMNSSPACLPVQFRQHVAPERFDPLLLVAADVVQVDLIESEVDELLDLLAVHFAIGRHQHAALEIVGADHLRHLLEIER